MTQGMKTSVYRNYRIVELPQCFTLTDPGGIMVKAYPSYAEMSEIQFHVDELITGYN